MEQNPLDSKPGSEESSTVNTGSLQSGPTNPSKANSGTAHQADPDLMIDRLSYEDTKQYVWRFVVAEKTVEKSLRQKEQELEQWKQRANLAQRVQDTTLIQEAQKSVKFLEQEVEKLRSEYGQLHDKNAVLKEKFKLKIQHTPSVDAHQLLAELEMLANPEEHKVKEKFEDIEAKEELEKLKSKMKKS
jgi:phage shock protein A